MFSEVWWQCVDISWWQAKAKAERQAAASKLDETVKALEAEREELAQQRAAAADEKTQQVVLVRPDKVAMAECPLADLPEGPRGTGGRPGSTGG